MATFQELIQSEKPVLVDFFAEWCGPCQMMTPELKNLVARVGDKATVIKVDVDKNQQVSQALNIRGVPTLMIFQKGEIKWRRSGFMTADQLETALKPFMTT
ncbi:MAG: thioredoxin [Flammeovirgaceae bacterium]|nr:thioredoxin [Flammeovirgaceae bacterium]MDW8287368.1 thioredoxin [Flammeovirgaceae bacterium]